MKGCLRKIIIFLILVAFFVFGGWAFLQEKIRDYKNPPRDEFVSSEKKYADFSNVSGDYQLTRCFNIFGYKKMNAKYLPTEQKITMLDIKDNNVLSEADFYSNSIDEKILTALNKVNDAYISLENFEVIKRGFIDSENQKVPYIIFSAKIKNIPFKTIKGVVAMYDTKLFYTIVDKKAFNFKITQDFISALKF